MKTREEKEERVREYLSGEMNPEERAMFEHELDTDEEINRLFRMQVRQYERIRWADRWGRLNEQQAEMRTMRRLHRARLMARVRYAAAVLAVCAVGIALWQWAAGTKDEKPVLAVVPSAGQNVPVLTLEGGEEIHIFSRDSSLFRSTGQADIRLTEGGELEYTAKDSLQQQVRYNKLTVPRGCEFNVTLADGSRVWLNAGSALRFPEAFTGKQRVVYLEGEGYFEVKRDERKPFIVKTEGMDLRVLGTSFNVKAYRDDENIVTTLVTGKIAQRYTGVDSSIVLTPSRQSVYNRVSGDVKTMEVDVRTVLAWREGRIAMDNARLEDIFRELSRWYDFEAVYTDPTLKDTRFYLHTNRYEEIGRILEHLQMTRGIRFTCIDKKIYVSK
ncbi:MAG: DUF4974 domain-containing protein [Marinifilaceae bacterium]|nr:DUF4974 domain-containing protein [Marinifilaceae bacterium]